MLLSLPSLHVQGPGGVVFLDAQTSVLEVVVPRPAPATPHCLIPWTDAFATKESGLRWAFLAYADRPHRDIPESALSSLLSGVIGIPAVQFSVKTFSPDNFIIICRSQAVRDSILATNGRPFPADALLFFRPWTRLAYASAGVLAYRVVIALRGVLVRIHYSAAPRRSLLGEKARGHGQFGGAAGLCLPLCCRLVRSTTMSP